MTTEALYAYRVRVAAVLMLSLIERGIIQLQEDHKTEAEPL